MFGSVSNWINNKLPQNIPTVSMPSMPNVSMPTVSMPTMPHMPDLFGKNKNQNNEETAAVSTTSDTNTTSETQPAAVSEEKIPNITQPEPVSETKQDLNQIEPVVDESKPANGEATEGGEEAEKNDQKFGINIGIDPTKALGNVKDIGNNIGSMLFSFGKNASSNVMKTASNLKDVIEKKTLIGDFSKENEKFINEKKNQKRKEDTMIPPWVGYHEEEKMKEQILALSSDSRNFLRSPPVGVDFQFDFNLAYPVAMATLEEDPNLKEMRFKLVPKQINEEQFWRNYFYRVSLIKQSAQLDQLNTENQNSNTSGDDSTSSSSNKKSGVTKQESGAHQNDSITTNEFVSDSYDQQEAFNDEDLKNELKQLKLNNKKQDDLEDGEWDKDLPEDIDSLSVEEIEKEINQMIGKN